MSNFYEKVYDNEASSIEQAILAEEVRFSGITTAVPGKFYIRILTPTVASSEVSVKNKAGLTSSNYITLSIPPYMLLQFMNITVTRIKIPTKMNPDTGVPTKYEYFNVLTTTSASTDTTSSKTKKTTSKKTTTEDTSSGSYVIPKGTVFFVEFLGGQAEADKANIIGISTYKVEGV